MPSAFFATGRAFGSPRRARASTAQAVRISVGRPRSARRRVPDLEFGRGKWFASRGDYSVKSDVDPSGESDAAVWHLSHGIPREFWRWELAVERFFPGEVRWGGRGYPQRRARANERATNGRERVDRRTARAGDPIRPRRGTPTGRESAPAFTVRLTDAHAEEATRRNHGCPGPEQGGPAPRDD